MSGPLVSFIIPYYNAGTTIQETIDSIFKQSYSNFDIWLINDGSTDPFSIKKLKDFEGNEKIHILHQENAGPSTARNNAILASNSKYYVPLDSDDLIEKETLSFAIENIQEYDVAVGDCMYFGARNDLKKQKIPTSEEILMNNPIAVCTIIKASVFKDILFDPQLDKLGLEDWEFWIHLFSKNYNFIYFEKVFFKIRVSENSRTFQVANNNLMATKKYVFKKHSEFLYSQYSQLFREKKDFTRLIDYKIGNWLLLPYRIIKRNLKK